MFLRIKDKDHNPSKYRRNVGRFLPIPEVMQNAVSHLYARKKMYCMVQ